MLADKAVNYLKGWEEKLLYLFLASLFFIKAPPFYYLPGASRLFSTHTLAKLLIIGIFGVIVLIKRQTLRKILKNEKLFIFIAFYFFAQSLSVLAAYDVVYFWRSYHNLLIAIFIFTLTLVFIGKKTINRFNSFVVFTGLLLVSLELSFFLFLGEVMPFIENLAQKEVLDAYMTNLSRGRFSLDLIVELFLPVFLAIAILPKIKNKKLKVISGILIPAVVFVSFFSNFRSRALMSLFGFLALLSLYFIKRRAKIRFKNAALFLLAVFAAILVALSVSNRLYSFNVVDRFILQDKREDLGTITFRTEAFEKSGEMFMASPYLGIGLGNYALYSVDAKDLALQRLIYLDEFREDYTELAAHSPHNVLFQLLSETGLLGVLSFLLLLAIFAFRDLKYFINHKLGIVTGYMISFWTILVFMLFNPAVSLFVIGWFWFMRGIVEGVYIKNLE